MKELIVTNLSALESKYGGKTNALLSSMDMLIAASRAKGVICKTVYIDDRRYKDIIGAVAVRNPSDAKQNLVAIDSVCSWERPDCIMILGAHDIIPFHNLVNPAYYDGGADQDEYVLVISRMLASTTHQSHLTPFPLI